MGTEEVDAADQELREVGLSVGAKAATTATVATKRTIERDDIMFAGWEYCSSFVGR